MLQQAIFILGLIALAINAQNFAQNLEQNIAQNFAQNLLPNESQKYYPPAQQPQQQTNDSAQEFTLQAIMQISNGTEKFSLELYKVMRGGAFCSWGGMKLNFFFVSRD